MEESSIGATMARRPWGVWHFSTEGKVDSRSPEEQAKYLLSQLEPKSDVIQDYLQQNGPWAPFIVPPSTELPPKVTSLWRGAVRWKLRSLLPTVTVRVLISLLPPSPHRDSSPPRDLLIGRQCME